MFPISTSSQTRPFPLRSRPLPPPVRFGLTPQGETKDTQVGNIQNYHSRDLAFNRMQGALKEAMAKYQYTIDEDLFTNYESKLTFNRARNQIHHLWGKVEGVPGVTGDDLKGFYETGKLGLVEESSDMFFEMYTLKALYSHLVTKEQVKKWSAMLPKTLPEKGTRSRELLEQGDIFNDARKAIKEDIKKAVEKKHPWAFQRFKDSVNEGWADPAGKNGPTDRALDLLSLIGMKCALMTKKDSGYSLVWDNIKLLSGEAEELREEMHGDSPLDCPAKWLIAGMAMLYSLPLMPYTPFRSIITNIVGKELNRPPEGAKQPSQKFNINYRDLMETVYSKQIGRQELDYSRPDIDAKLSMSQDIRVNKDAMKKGNAKRKCVLKPYELWQESAVLKNALRQGEDKEKNIAGKVLNTGA